MRASRRKGKQNMKRSSLFGAAGRRRGIRLLAAAVIGSAFLMTACAAADKAPVIAERTSAQPGETGPDTGSAAADRASGDPEPEGSRSRQSLRQQTEAPDRYQTEMKSQYLEISSDVPVTVPEVSAIPVRAVEPAAPYTAAALEQFKAVISQAEGIQWAEGDGADCESLDGVYYLSFSAGGAVDGTSKSPMMWIINKKAAAGSGADYSANDLSGLKLSAREQAQTEQQLREKAEQVLRQLDLEDFQMTGSKWKQILKYEDKWVPDGRYAVALRFSRTVDGVPEPANQTSALGMTAAGSQYVDVVYAADGQLLEFKNINREKYGKIVEESGFLLPFDAVAQIFEQYCRNVYETNHPVCISDGVQPEQPEQNPDAMAHMTLSAVKLEYMPVYEYDTKGVRSAAGKIVPVWNFYGGLTVGYQEESKYGYTRAGLTAASDVLLLSVDAGDGKVYGK